MLTSGTRLGPYEIQSAIGAGGMGEVYRAADTNLGRQVAIKVLPEAFAQDADRLARFDREAKTLASLNHPNIAAIYGLERSDGTTALVMELVEGEDLSQRIARGAIPLDEALPIAKQIADALEAAHEQGIIHRDLKPANIKVRPEGTVKVLDFGLAKALEPAGVAGADSSQSPTITSPAMTGMGVILGTAAYMSPEQAKGRPVDRRTDLWAFGAVLYEMLSGRPAFEGDNVSELIAHVLMKEPDWSALPDTVPRSIHRLVTRCLAKDRRQRLDSAAAARFALDDAWVLPEGQPTRGRDSLAGSSRQWKAIAIASLVIAVAAISGAAYLWARAGATRAPTDRIGPILATRLTDYGLAETDGALSPDGRSFAFVSSHGGNPDVWLRQVSGGDPVRLTNDSAGESDLVFSRDGESLYFTRADSDGRSIWQMGALGGHARKLIANAWMPIPDPKGQRLAYLGADPEDAALWALFVSAPSGESRRRLAPRLPVGSVRVAWSPDGRVISYSHGALFGPVNLFVADVDSDQVRQVTHFTGPNEGLSRGASDSGQQWLPDNRHLVVSYLPFARPLDQPELGILDVADGSITRLTVAVEQGYSRPSVSVDGSKMIVESRSLLREVWKFPFGQDADRNGQNGARLLARGSPAWTFVSRDGRLLLFNGSLSGSPNLFLTGLGLDSQPKQITTVPGGGISHSSLSPDGTRVAFASSNGDVTHIWTQHTDGTNLRQLTAGDTDDVWPVWSPDGRSIVYTAQRGSVREMWTVPSDGGKADKLFDGFFRGDWTRTADGRNLLVTVGAGGTLWDVDRKTVVWKRNLGGEGLGMPMFSQDGRRISLAVRESPDRDALLVLDAATGASHVAVRLPFHVMFRANWVDDDTAFIVNRNDLVSHIVMLERFWAPK